MLFVSMKRGRRGPRRGVFSQLDLTNGRRPVQRRLRVALPIWRALTWLPALLFVGLNWFLGSGASKPRRTHAHFVDRRKK